MPWSPVSRAPPTTGRASCCGTPRPASSMRRSCSGFRRRNNPIPLALRLDQSVPAVVPPVDDVHLAGLVAAEHEEIVSDEPERQRVFFRAHRGHGELNALANLLPSLVLLAL